MEMFSFGAVIAHMGPEDELTRLREDAHNEASAERPQLPGVQVSFKMTNPNKVPCTVNLGLKPRVPAEMPAGRVGDFLKS